MTTNQLYHDSLCMGFDRRCTDGEADFEKIFESAVNRAQETLSALFPLYCQTTLYVQEEAPIFSVDSHHLRPHRRRDWTCTGGTYYTFTAHGRGTVTLTQSGLTLARYTIDSPLTEKRIEGTIKTEGEILIRAQTNDGTLALHDLRVLFENGSALRREGKEFLCPLTAISSDALSLDTPPKDSDGRALKEGRDYRVQNGILYLSERVKGKLNLTLTRAPRRFDLSCDAPDVRAEAVSLLPLLTASYAWLDDDRDKALFYLAMYRESLARVRTNGRCAGVGGGYGEGNGW